MKIYQNKSKIKYMILSTIFFFIGISVNQTGYAQTSWVPDKTIKIVVPWPPGGGADTTARITAEAMRIKLGQPVIVENKGGATGAIGSDQVYKSAPDGYTLLLSTMDSQAINPHFHSLPFDTKKFTPISGLAKTGLVLLGRPDLKAKNIEQLVDLAKNEKLSYASPGVGSSMHVLSEFLGKQMQAKELLHVPYQGLGPAVQAVAASTVDLVIVPTVVASQWKDKLNVIAVTSQNRLAQFPDVPTLNERGISLVSDSWLSLIGPPNMPKNIVVALNSAAQSAIKDPAVTEKMTGMGLLPDLGTSDEYKIFFINEYDRWGKVIGQIKK